MQINIMDFGAVGDGITNDTSAIQAAIDACVAGTVIIPGGHTFRCGMLVLHSNLELHLQMGSVLKGSDDLADYLPCNDRAYAPDKMVVPSYENCEYTGLPRHFFLYAKGCRNLAITGLGRIHGNEEIFYGEATKYHIEGIFYPRVPMLYMEDVEQLTLQNITLEHSAFWTVHLVGCRDVLIDGIRILNDLRMANCDGIDPDHCQNVRISGCHIQCADDCIVFKNTAAAAQYGPCENITVSNCTLTSTSAAIKFGSESEDLFRNILVENCVISRSNRGISLQLRDKGSIENVVFQNITIHTRLFMKDLFWGQAEPIAITCIPRNERTQPGTIRNIYFNRILCESENGIVVYSQEPGHISGIHFESILLKLKNQTNYEKGLHDLRPTFAVPFTQDGLQYVHLHQAENVTFANCQYTCDEEMGTWLQQGDHL